MAPTRTQPDLLGLTSNSSPNTSSKAPVASSSRSHVGHPYLRPVRGEASTDPTLDLHLGIFGPYSKVMFNGRNVTLSQHTYHNQGLEGIQKLYQNSSPAAAYNSRDRYDPPKCHPNTRTGLLNMTQNLANNDSPPIMWLYGSAGAGKSAIAQTTCERLSACSNLAASFFFSRTSPADHHRGHEGRFVTTIAYQLTESIPNLRHYVEQVILARPSVFDLKLPEQVVALIFDPLSQLKRDRAEDDGRLRARIIVVDGLDECKDETGQKQVLEALATLVRHQDIFPFSVFLASRPELQISTWFATADAEHSQLFRKLSLLDHCDSDHDIKLFLKDEATMLRQSHPFRAKIPANWPPPTSLERIVKRANGQFVYASTIMKYIKDLRYNPTSRLEAVLQNSIPQEDQPYAELDALYFYILKRAKYPDFVRRLLGFRLATLSFYGRFDGNRLAEYLEEFLSLPCPVDTLLIDLQSIMTCDTADFMYQSWAPEGFWFSKTPTSTLFHHASLVEFLQDPRRSQDFYINVPQFDQDITELALQQIGYASDWHYVTYCFLTVLQTKASRRQTYTDRIRVQLARWDCLHNDVLCEILSSLTQKINGGDLLIPGDEYLFTIIDVNLSNAFSPALSRKREQYRQMLERVGIPGQLLIIFENRVMNPGLDHQEIAGVPQLRQIFPHLYNHTGADVWHFFDQLPEPLCKEFGGLSWHSYRILLSEFCDSSIQEQEELLQVEGFLRNRSFEARDAVLFCLQRCLLLLDPSKEACKSKEVQAVLDQLKENEGENWRSKVMARRLSALESFIWEHCPLSADIVSALERISETFFPSHIASNTEDTPLLMPILNGALRTELLCSFSHPWFAHPGWHSSPMPWHLKRYSSRYTLKYIHNYMRLYYIRKSADNDISDTSAIPAQFVGRMTIDPVTNYPMHVGRHPRRQIPVTDNLVDYYSDPV